MAVFRVERNRGYTVMSNHHLRNKELSLKAKGLLSQMLSLPEDWDYTLAGLSLINREKIDAIREAVRELERAGYIVRSRERDVKGRLRGAEYVIYEQPQPPTLDLPTLESPTLDNPTQEKPTLEKPTQENPTQLNKELSRTDLPKKEKSTTDLSSTDSIPILSSDPSPSDGAAATPPERKRKEAATQSAVEIYREIIMENISYDILITDSHVDRDRLDELVDIMLETVCTARATVRIAGDDYPAELVKAKFMKLDSEHIRFVLDCTAQTKKCIKYIRYADDFILGVKGSQEDCQWIKSKLSEFIRETLKMELSEEKTLITHSSERARFLGYDVRVRRSSIIKHGGPGKKTKRTLNNSCELSIPFDDKIHSFIFAKEIAIQKPDGKLMPVRRKSLLRLTDLEIVSAYNAELRGICNYYGIASNFYKLCYFSYLMEYSCLKTLASKHKCTIAKVVEKFKDHNGEWGIPYETKTGQKRCYFAK